MVLQEDINEKLMRASPNEIINKRLSALQEVSRLPRFISGYAIKKSAVRTQRRAIWLSFPTLSRNITPNQSRKIRFYTN